MHIHTIKQGESISEIAEKYGVWEADLREINGISDGDGAVGEEMLVLIPTRSYTAQHGDTIDRISIRFGVPKRELLSQNPKLCDRQPSVGEKIAVRYGERRYGTAVANGYFYKGCSNTALRRTLPYLTYVTFGVAVADKRGIHRIADDRAEVNMVSAERKIPLIRVYDKHEQRYSSLEEAKNFADELIDLAQGGGYKGIVLNACNTTCSAEHYCSFLIILRKLMIGCDLILITEINQNSPIEYSEYADGSVMYYPKYTIKNPPSVKEGERKVLADFACRGESTKTFVDLPSLASYNGGYITYSQAIKMARQDGNELIKNQSTLLSYHNGRKQGECVFNSLESIKSLLELTREFDYMGVCFDIMRTPLSHLMMYNAMFKTHYYNSVRTREGCSRVSEE